MSVAAALPTDETLEREALASLQGERLGRLVGQLVGHNAFYTRKLEAAGVRAGELRFPRDLARLPLTTKAELTADQAAIETGLNPSKATIEQAVQNAKNDDLIVVITNRAGLETQPGQADLVRRLESESRAPVVAVGVRDAYDVNKFPKVQAYLATYSYTAAALDSLVRVLFGELDPTGRLPVTIPKDQAGNKVLYPYGHGLEY